MKSTTDNREAVLYIITDLRLIKLDIEPNEIKSSNFGFDSIISVERKLIDGNQAQVRIILQNDSFGLRYPNNEHRITEFFQFLDKVRIVRRAGHV